MINKKWVNKNRYLLPISIVLTVILAYIWITNNGVIVFYGDSLKQQIPFYSGIWEKVHSMNLGFWDWSMVLGTNSFAQTFYCHLNNPYLYLVLLFPKEWIPQVYTLTNILKLLLTYISAFWWLTKIKRSEVSSIIGALIISFSAWFMTMYEWGHLLDVFPLYFVLLILVDDFILKEKRNVFVIVIAVMTIINYYLSYMFLPFLMVYACYRMYVLLDIQKNNVYFLKLIRLFGLILLGVAISGFVLLPSAYIVLKTPRINESHTSLIYGFNVIYRIVTSIFLPVAYRTQPNVLTNATGIGWYEGVSLFTTFLTPITLIIFLRTKKSKEKSALLVFLLLFFIATCVPLMYKLLQGTLETRWFYMFSIISALITSYTLDDIFIKKNKYRMLYVSILIISLLGVFYLYSNSNDLIVNKEKLYFFLVLFLIFSSGYILSLHKKSKIMLMSVLTLEALLMYANGLCVNEIVDHEHINTVEYSDVINDIKENDTGFYRVQFSQRMLKNNASIDDYNYVMANLPYSYDIMGTSGYSSLYTFDQDKYLNRYKEEWTFYQTEGRIFINQLESIKYWISYKDENPPFGFIFHKNVGDKTIYKNAYYIELGYYSDNILSEEVLNGLSILKQDMLLVEYTTTTDSKNQDYIASSFLDEENQWVLPDYYEYNFSKTKSDLLFIIENFKMDHMHIVLKNKGNVINKRDIYQKDYISLYFPQNIEFDQLLVMVDERVIYDSGINVGYIENFDYIVSKFNTNKNNALNNVTFNNDHLTAEYFADSNIGLIVTSIPYDIGWSLKLNGEIADVMRINNGFIGFKPVLGENRIELDYYPPLLKEGIYLSVFGIFMLVTFNIKYKKKNLLDNS